MTRTGGRNSPGGEFDPPFDIAEPERLGGPIVFNSPHSGSCYPRAFLKASQLDPLALRRSEDCYVDALFADAVPLGAPLMRANFPRVFLDVNREPYELDPKLFDGDIPEFANTRSLRVTGGLGTIPRLVSDSDEVYGGPIPIDAAMARIESYYKPYHRALSALLGRVHDAFGAVFLIDCHSMPSALAGESETGRPDIVLGDRFGTSCNGILTAFAESTLTRMGYLVVRNKPYAGGYITEHYGAPKRGVHALQIEINRALYMDEETLEKTTDFVRLQSDLAQFSGELIALAEARLSRPRFAAE